jgi:hypothetical protein
MKSIIVKNVRLSYFFGFKPRKNEDGSLKYSTSCIIPKDHPQVAEIQAAIEAVRGEGAGFAPAWLAARGLGWAADLLRGSEEEALACAAE